MKTFLTLISLFLSTICFSQIQVIQFNAEWNAANGVNWLSKLSDCKVGQIDIAKNKEAQSKRYQANIMMQMEAKLEDVQTLVDETVMEAF